PHPLEEGAVGPALEGPPIQQVEERPVEEGHEDGDRGHQQCHRDAILLGVVTGAVPPAEQPAGRAHASRSVVSGSKRWTLAGSTVSRMGPPAGSGAIPPSGTTPG